MSQEEIRHAPALLSNLRWNELIGYFAVLTGVDSISTLSRSPSAHRLKRGVAI